MVAVAWWLGYHMEEGSKPFALIYRIYYRLLGTQLNPSAINHREPSGKTMLIKCSTPDAKVQIPKMIPLNFPLNGSWNKNLPLQNLFLMSLILLIFNNILTVLLK